MSTFEPLSVGEIQARFDFRPTTDGNMSEWAKFLGREGLDEYPTAEFVAGLSRYLHQRSVEISKRTQQTTRILEVAAGRGVLGTLVAQALQEQHAPATVAACDDDSLSSFVAPLPIVQRMDYRDAVRTVRPHIILGAWLPGAVKNTPRNAPAESENWTPVFRQASDTYEYILIGQVGVHAGDATWGRDKYGQPVPVPEYEAEGFRRADLDHLREFQFCYKSVIGDLHPSQVITFVREAHETSV